MRGRDRLGARGIAGILLVLVPAWVAVLPAARAEKAATEEVIVSFESQPVGAWVEIDGEPACVTPCRRALPTGKVGVTMKKPEYRTRSEKVAVRADMGAVSWTLAAREGRIRVNAADAGGNRVAGDVYVDGAWVGPTDAAIPVRIGERLVVVRSPAGAWWTRVTVREAETRALAATVSSATVPPAFDADGNPRRDVPVGNSYARGPKDAPVTIVVFLDYQCPFCARGEETIDRLVELYPGKIRYVVKAKILPMHPKAPLAHNAVLAAGEQGRFWEMHARVLTNQSALDRDAFLAYARELGLDLDRFAADLDDPGRFAAFLRVEEDESVALEVRGTPTYFINGRAVRGARPIEDFRTVIDEELGVRPERDGGAGPDAASLAR